jgi:hypothetical protein
MSTIKTVAPVVQNGNVTHVVVLGNAPVAPGTKVTIERPDGLDPIVGLTVTDTDTLSISQISQEGTEVFGASTQEAFIAYLEHAFKTGLTPDVQVTLYTLVDAAETSLVQIPVFAELSAPVAITPLSTLQADS